jgi:hypothetical protein
VAWLQERVEPNARVDVDFDALLTDAPSLQPEQEAQQPPPPPPNEEDGSRDSFEEVPPWWGLGGWISSNPKPPQPWIVQGTVPLVGVGLMSGQTGASKTWLSVHLSACVLTGRSFAGMYTDHSGGVLYFEVENSNVEIRIRAACAELGADATKLPFLLNESIGPLFARGRPDKREKELLRKKIMWAKEAMHARYGIPLRLVFLDTLTSIAGIEDHDATAENAAFMGLCADLAKEFEIFIIVCDHFGKNIDAGTRGSTAKEARADVVLAVIGKPDQPIDEPRKVRWRKMRNGPSGREMQFRLRHVDIEIGGAVVKTCTVEFLLNGTDGDSASRTRSDLTSEQKVALNILADCIRQNPVPLPMGADLPGLCGTLVDTWREQWRAFQSAVSGRDKGSSERFKKQWQRMFAELKLRGAINLVGEIVWSPSSHV